MPAYAAEHLVLVEAGFPHHTKLDDATKKHQIHGMLIGLRDNFLFSA